MCLMCSPMPKDITREELWHKLKIAREGYARLWYVINGEYGDVVPDNVKEEFNKSEKEYREAIKTTYSEEDLKEIAARREETDRFFRESEKNNERK